MAGHTKGPWFAREYVSPAGTWFVRSNDNKNVTGQAGGKMNEADARLIAAAPELLEALVELEDAIEVAVGLLNQPEEHQKDLAIEIQRRVEKARAAIHRATYGGE